MKLSPNTFSQNLLLMMVLLAATTIYADNSESTRLSGVWVGYFAYEGQPSDEGTGFTLLLTQDKNTVKGKITELVINNEREEIAVSSVLGFYNQNNKVLNFIKSYDGSGGRNHSVNYELRPTNEQGVFVGKWTLGNSSGPVVIALVPFKELIPFFSEE